MEITSDNDNRQSNSACVQEVQQNGHSPGGGVVGPGFGDTADTEQLGEQDQEAADTTHQSFSLLQMSHARANGLTKWLSKTNVIGECGVLWPH